MVNNDVPVSAGEDSAAADRGGSESAGTGVSGPNGAGVPGVGAPWAGLNGKAILAIAALCAATAFPAAWLVTKVQGTFGIPAEYEKYSQPPPEILGPILASMRSAQRSNAALAFGICGALLCGVLGAAVCVAVRDVSRALKCTVQGIVIGAIFGAVGGVGNAMVFQEFTESTMDELFQAMLIHSPAWLMLGIAAGLGMSFVTWTWGHAGQMVVAGVGAAVLSAILFPFLSTQFFPDAHTAARYPDTFGSLVIWIGLPFGLISIAVLRSARRGPAAATARTTTPLSA